MSAEHTDLETVAGNNPITVELDGLAPTTAAKQAEREELSQQIEEFLASGGKINRVPANVMADPPKKPTSNYGSQPI